MNERSDIDRVLSHWMDDGPSTMPDRVVDIVADRISVQPQRRPWRLLRRLPVNTFLKLGAAAAAVLIVAVVAWNLLPGRGGIGAVDPTPTPGPSPISGPSPTPWPSASSVSTPWWNPRGTPCGEVQSLPYWCAGELTAGTHTSGALQPGLTYAVPAGWVNLRDYAKYYAIFPDTPANRTAVATGDPVEGIIVAIGEPAIQLANADCSGTAQPGAGTTSAEIAAALEARDGLVTAAPAAVSVSGLTGRQLDISLEPGWTAACGDDPEIPAVPLIGTVRPMLAAGEGRSRLIILDTPDGGGLVIRLHVGQAIDFEPFLAVAMPIVESFQFDLTP